MHLDLSEYIGKYISLPNGRMTLEELVDYLTSEGYKVTKIVDRPNIKTVTVNNAFRVTLKGFVRRVGRNKERHNEWESERSQRQKRKAVNIDNELMRQFEKVTGAVSFATWVKRKMHEEVYGVWQSKLVRPKQSELVNGMILIDDGKQISLCHISEFETKEFLLWARIPSRSFAEKNQKNKGKGGR